MVHIFKSKEYVEAVDKWIGTNVQKHAAFLASKKAQVPPILKPAGKYYRGMYVPEDFLNKLQSPSGVIFPLYTSWTMQRKSAEIFAKSAGPAKKGFIGIIIEKSIPTSKVVVNLYTYVSMLQYDVELDDLSIDSALKEFEVLIDKNIKITMKDITFVK